MDDDRKADLTAFRAFVFVPPFDPFPQIEETTVTVVSVERTEP